MAASPHFLDWKSKARYEGRVRLTSSSLTTLRTSNPGLVGINLSQGLCTPPTPHKITRCTFPHSIGRDQQKACLDAETWICPHLFFQLQMAWSGAESAGGIQVPPDVKARGLEVQKARLAIVFMILHTVFQCKASVTKDFLPN